MPHALGFYRDQLQWQLHVTGSERLLFVVENRHTLRKESMWVERDEYRIFILARHADAFLLEMDGRRANFRPSGVGPKEEPAKASVVKLSPMVQDSPPVSSAAAPPAHVPSRTATTVADEDETRLWSEIESAGLVAGYTRGASIAMLGSSVGTTHRAVVFELSRLMLKPEGPMVDRAAEKFGHFWSSREEQALRDLYLAGMSLPSIARKLQRDQLGVAFRLFENHIPQLPVIQVPSVAPLVVTPSGTGSSSESAATTRLETDALSATASGTSERTGALGPAPVPSLAVFMRGVHEPTPPETIVGSLDPDNDSDDNRSWSSEELKRLLRIYGDSEDLDINELARHFRTTSRSVVIALTYLLLEPYGPLEDPACTKHRQLWTQGEVDLVHDSFRAGATLYQIAQALERDQLSLAFKLFGERLPEVSALPQDLPVE